MFQSFTKNRKMEILSITLARMHKHYTKPFVEVPMNLIMVHVLDGEKALHRRIV